MNKTEMSELTLTRISVSIQFVFNPEFNRNKRGEEVEIRRGPNCLAIYYFELANGPDIGGRSD